MKTINSDKPERHFIVAKNSETVSIASGTPVVYTMSGTDDGLLVEKPASVGAAAQADFLFAGVAAEDMAASRGPYLVQVFGLTPEAVTIRVQTRANSTQSVASNPDAAIGAPLLLDTVNNCFYTAASVGVATAYKVRAILAASVAGISASIVGTDIASSGDNSGWYALTVSTTTAKVFLRAM